MPRRHVEHKYRRAPSDCSPIEPARDLPFAIVAGDEGYRGIGVAMSDRDAGIGEPANTRRDPRHDAERDTGSGEGESFLPAPSENARIAALKAQHPLAVLCCLDEPR